MSRSMSYNRRECLLYPHAVTLIELLVVISIIGAVLAFTFPAVQRARESARRAQCKNQLRQIALACLGHVEAHRHFPSGGWGWRWMGDPDRGFDSGQPGGWVYNVLPYLEQQSLRQTGAGLPPDAKRLAVRDVAETALPVFNCPSRRRPSPIPFLHPYDFINIERPAVTGRSDYAANAGDLPAGQYGEGPSSLAEGDSRDYKWDQLDRTGVVFRRSMIAPTHVRDGASQTYLVGEAFLDPNHYTTGDATNDDQGMFVGYDRDTLRVTHPDWPPRRDDSINKADHSFGSSHASGFHAAFCDGSVRQIKYAIATEVHRRLGSRAGRLPIDTSSL